MQTIAEIKGHKKTLPLNEDACNWLRLVVLSSHGTLS